MPNVIALRDLSPLATGGSRFVFRHPKNADHLIKVIRPEVIQERFGAGAKWYKRLRRFGKYISYHRETQEYLAVYEDLGSPPPFLQEIVGFANTDLGLGLVVKGIFGRNGELAPTLHDLLKQHRYTPEIATSLEHCFQEILNCNVIISDLNVGNFAYLEDEKRFVMIDGQGNTNPLGLKGLSRILNRRSKLSRFKRFRRRIERHKIQQNHP